MTPPAYAPPPVRWVRRSGGSTGLVFPAAGQRCEPRASRFAAERSGRDRPIGRDGPTDRMTRLRTGCVCGDLRPSYRNPLGPARNVEDVQQTRAGIGYGAAAYLLWGLFPLYWPLLEPAGTIEILAERMAWSFVVMLVVLRFTGGFGGVRAVVRDRRQFGYLAAAAFVITFNWGSYIYGVNTGHVVETSLGYFINPLL